MLAALITLPVALWHCAKKWLPSCSDNADLAWIEGFMGRARFCTGGRLVCFRHLPCGCVSQRHSCRPCPRTSWQHKRACRSCRMHPVERRFLINALMYGNKRDRLLMLYLRLCRFRCNSPWQHCYSCSKPIDEMASGIDS